MKFLKKYLVPHRDNSWKPHLFRQAGLVSTFALIVFVFLFVSFGNYLVKRTDLTALVLPNVLVDYANIDRNQNNSNSLVVSPVLEKAARLKAEDMASKSYFAHTSPEGRTPWYWFGEAGYYFSYAGENLAVNFTDSQDVNQAWMNSPGHRQNLLNDNFTEIGIATAQGTYQGRPTTFVVELFGTPIVANKIPALPPTTLTSNNSTKLTTTASSSVLGASGENDLYIAVANAGVSSIESKNSNIKYSNFIERMIFSPGSVLNTIYSLIASIIFIGVVFISTSRNRKEHKWSIIWSVGLLFVMFALAFAFNSYIFGPLLVA